MSVRGGSREATLEGMRPCGGLGFVAILSALLAACANGSGASDGPGGLDAGGPTMPAAHADATTDVSDGGTFITLPDSSSATGDDTGMRGPAESGAGDAASDDWGRPQSTAPTTPRRRGPAPVTTGSTSASSSPSSTGVDVLYGLELRPHV